MSDEQRSVIALEVADRMLAEIASVDDAMKLINYAERARVYARQSKLGTSAINHSTVIKIRAEQQLATMVDQGQERGVIAERGRDNQHTVASAHSALATAMTPFFPNAPVTPATLADIGVAKERLAEARVLRDAYTPEQLKARQDEANERDEVLSRQTLIAEARAENARNSAIQSKRVAVLFPVYESLEALARMDMNATEWAASVPEYSAHRVTQNLSAAHEWLSELMEAWTCR